MHLLHRPQRRRQEQPVRRDPLPERVDRTRHLRRGHGGEAHQRRRLLASRPGVRSTPRSPNRAVGGHGGAATGPGRLRPAGRTEHDASHLPDPAAVRVDVGPPSRGAREPDPREAASLREVRRFRLCAGIQKIGSAGRTTRRTADFDEGGPHSTPRRRREPGSTLTGGQVSADGGRGHEHVRLPDGPGREAGDVVLADTPSRAERDAHARQPLCAGPRFGFRRPPRRHAPGPRHEEPQRGSGSPVQTPAAQLGYRRAERLLRRRAGSARPAGSRNGGRQLALRSLPLGRHVAVRMRWTSRIGTSPWS